jgi:hypothetical protein
MKIIHAILAFIILSIPSTRLLALDFLNDPFFKQLASELDTMFGTDDDDKAPAPGKSAKPDFPGGLANHSVAVKPADANAAKAAGVTHDASKDLKTLFIENLAPAKAAEKNPTSMFGGGAAAKQKFIISARKKQAYNHFMNDLVKKMRFIERFVSGNPGRTFGHHFTASFDQAVDYIDQIDASNHLINSKKMYLRNFFSPSLQKTREQIVTLIPKLDAMLLKLRPLLNKEESVDDDIARMQRAAGASSFSTTPKSRRVFIKPTKPKQHTPTPAQTKNLKGKSKPSLKKYTPSKKHAPPPPPMLPADFELEKIMKKGSLL